MSKTHTLPRYTHIHCVLILHSHTHPHPRTHTHTHTHSHTHAHTLSHSHRVQARRFFCDLSSAPRRARGRRIYFQVAEHEVYIGSSLRAAHTGSCRKTERGSRMCECVCVWVGGGGVGCVCVEGCACVSFL